MQHLLPASQKLEGGACQSADGVGGCLGCGAAAGTIEALKGLCAGFFSVVTGTTIGKVGAGSLGVQLGTLEGCLQGLEVLAAQLLLPVWLAC